MSSRSLVLSLSVSLSVQHTRTRETNRDSYMDSDTDKDTDTATEWDIGHGTLDTGTDTVFLPKFSISALTYYVPTEETF